MPVHRLLTWLRERPKGDFTVGWVLRGEHGFINAVLLPKQLELGRAARLVERVIFLGSMAAYIHPGSLSLGSLGQLEGFGGGIELAVIAKMIAVVAGWVVQFSLLVVAYVVARPRTPGTTASAPGAAVYAKTSAKD